MTNLKWVGEPPPEPLFRPKCPNCKTPLRPDIEHESVRDDLPGGGFGYKIVSRRWRGYSSYGAFCKLRCCEQFANAAHKAGFKIP